MANLTATGMNLLRQQARFTNLPPPDVLWQTPTPYDDMVERELLRQKSEYFQGLMAEQHEFQNMARAITNIPAALTNNRHNKRLLLCQP